MYLLSDNPVAPTQAVQATVVSVHDADTLRAIVHLPFGDDIRSRPWRAYGYDAWEVDYTRKNSNPPITPDEILKGKQARAELLALLTSGQLYFEDPGQGQTYDRVVSTWWLRNPDGSWVYIAKYAEDHGWLRTPRTAWKAPSREELPHHP